MYQIQFGQLSTEKLEKIYDNLSSKHYIEPPERQVLKQVTEILKIRKSHS